MTSGHALGTVGIVRPTTRSGGFEDLLRMLPDGIGVTHTCLSVQRGTVDEFKKVIRDYEEKVAEFAAAERRRRQSVRRAALHGAGLCRRTEADRRLGGRNTRCRCSPRASSHVDALRALGAKKFVGTSYFRGDLNKIYAKYFVDAGFDVLDMAGMDVDFEKAPQLTSQQVYDFVKGAFRANRHGRSDLHARARLARLRHDREAGARPRRAGGARAARAMLGYPAAPAACAMPVHGLRPARGGNAMMAPPVPRR